jgi:cell wall-associated NlpC family hydrolase
VTGQTATGGSVRSRSWITLGGSSTGWTPIATLVAVLAAGLLLGAGAASADPSVSSKQAQAQAILAQVQDLNSSLEQTVESYNYANIQLQGIDTDLRSNGRNLVAAKRSLKVAQRAIAQRLRDLYVNGSGDSTLEVLLGSSSLDDIITRLDAIQRVSKQDAHVLNEVKRYRREVEAQRAKLRDARAKQAQVVAERAAEKRSIESRVAEQQRLLASVKDEIVKLHAAEERRQAELAAQARARLEAQQQAAAAAEAAQQATPTIAPDYIPDPVYDPNLPAPRYGSVVSIALQYLGVPYVWGGSSPSPGFDCSGFTSYVFAQVGVYLPHHAASQYGYGLPVPRDQLAAGDLVFFDGLGHVGIYIGGGQFVHAPHTGDVVKISSLYESWYSATFVGARRL